MPPVHPQHKESMLCQTKGVSICPHTFGCFHMFGCPSMFDAPYFLMPLMFGWLHVSLDAPHMPPCMLQHPYMFGCPPYLWMMFGCPLYIHNTKKACFVRLGVSICTHTFGCPLYINNKKKACFVRLRGVHMPPYIWMPPICLDAAICLDAPPVHLNAPICLDAPYVWMALHVWMSSICFAVPCMFGCPPNVWGIQRYEDIQIYGVVQTYRGHMDMPSV